MQQLAYLSNEEDGQSITSLNQDREPLKVLFFNNGNLDKNYQNYTENKLILSNNKIVENVRILYMGWNGNVDILQLIIDCKCSMLKMLTLSGNNLESLQIFSRIYMPELLHLQVTNNPITSIKSLRKANLPKLKQLSLQIFNDAEQNNFSQCNWPNLTVCIYQFHQEILWFNKLVKSNFMLQIGVFGSNRVTPNKIMKRYPKLDDNHLYHFLTDTEFME